MSPMNLLRAIGAAGLTYGVIYLLMNWIVSFPRDLSMNDANRSAATIGFIIYQAIVFSCITTILVVEICWKADFGVRKLIITVLSGIIPPALILYFGVGTFFSSPILVILQLASTVVVAYQFFELKPLRDNLQSTPPIATSSLALDVFAQALSFAGLDPDSYEIFSQRGNDGLTECKAVKGGELVAHGDYYSSTGFIVMYLVDGAKVTVPFQYPLSS